MGDLAAIAGLGAISDSALAKIVGRFPAEQRGTDADERAVLKRLRELAHDTIDERHSIYGAVAQVLNMPSTPGREDIKWSCANISALICRMANKSTAYRDALRTWSEHSSYQRPLRMILYTDEIVPGNVLNQSNTRRFYSFYLSFLECGRSLSSELVWLFAGAMLTKDVKAVYGGLSTVIRVLLRSYFLGPLSLRHAGVNVMVGQGETRTLFIDFHGIWGDAPAMLGAYGVKNSGGVRPCIKCKNCVLESSGLSDGEYLQALGCYDLSKFDSASDHEIFETSDLLHEMARHATSKRAASEAEKIHGQNINFEGLLQDADLRPHVSPASGSRYDAMHIVYANGIARYEVQHMMQVLKEHMGLTFDDLQSVFPAGWRFPSALSHVLRYNKNTLFQGNRMSDCGWPILSASEMLGALPVIRFFAEAIVEQSERCTDRVRKALNSFFAMVRVHETLDAVKKQRIGPEPLLEMLCGIH